MNIKTINLTPGLAKEWLETMPDYQRSVSKVVVAEYAKDMANDRWVNQTGDAFRFNKQGQMIDGQHRCLAVIESGVTIQATIIEGLDDEVYMVLDKGRKRTAADTIRGGNANMRAAIAKALISLNDGNQLASIIGGNVSKAAHPISAVEAAEVANENDAIISKILDCHLKLRSANNGRFSAPVTTCLAACVAETTGSIDMFESFCNELVKPVQERAVVCTMAREKAANFNVSKGKSKNAMVFSIYYIAFKHWANGTTPKVIQTSTVTRDVNAIAVKRDWDI